MTPDAVLLRYVQLVNDEPLDVGALVRLITSDADLLERWIGLLGCPVVPRALVAALSDLDQPTLASLARAQISTLTPVAGAARLSMDRWRGFLMSACLGQALARALELSDPDTVRLQTLLAVSGVIVADDPLMAELAEFRGSPPDLLLDAHPVLRIVAVVEAHDVHGARAGATLATRLLRVDEAAYDAALLSAATVGDATIAELGVPDDDGADWAERVWRQQQAMAFSNVISLQATRDRLHHIHRLVTAALFRRNPKTFLIEGDIHTKEAGEAEDVALVLADGSELDGFEIRLADSTSAVARCLSERRAREVVDSSQIAVVDRQLMRRLGVESLLCVPMVDADMPVGVMVFGLDEGDDGVRDAMETYARAVGQWLASSMRDERTSGSTMGAYRDTLEKQLREIVHEANNPLSIVQNYLHILELRLKEDTNTTEQLRLIREEITRAAEIFRRVIELPTAETAAPLTAEIRITQVDVNAVTLRVCELIAPDGSADNVRVVQALDHASPAVQTDADRLTQVIINLVKNAVEALVDGGTVTVSTAAGVFRGGREGIEVVIHNEGPALPREVLDKLFLPKQSAKGGDHAGLGLYIVSQLVGELSGGIDVRTSAGRGTAFTVFLPLRINGS